LMRDSASRFAARQASLVYCMGRGNPRVSHGFFRGYGYGYENSDPWNTRTRSGGSRVLPPTSKLRIISTPRHFLPPIRVHLPPPPSLTTTMATPSCHVTTRYKQQQPRDTDSLSTQEQQQQQQWLLLLPLEQRLYRVQGDRGRGGRGEDRGGQ
jgi:hypothetical protein